MSVVKISELFDVIVKTYRYVTFEYFGVSNNVGHNGSYGPFISATMKSLIPHFVVLEKLYKTVYLDLQNIVFLSARKLKDAS